MRVVSSIWEGNRIVQLYKYYIVESVLIVKKSGFRELIHRRGWKFVAAIVAYYLVRDTIVYVILPYCVAHKIF